ncbi:MAG: pyrroline-5-carboxylate reductase, partial [Chloroflexota bacterium]|nr:pyrroline-5-carboxylate reductase [Chloroflexota bacterium]
KAGLSHNSVIRIMPNTPAQIGQGMSVWYSTDSVSESDRLFLGQILGTLGDEVHVEDEKFVDMATALSGSGPAYVFLFIESLIDSGVYLGMSRDMSRRLVLQTILGSSELVKQSGKHPAELKDMVTSPGGTTIEALVSMEDEGFRASVIKAVRSAYDRSLELGG